MQLAGKGKTKQKGDFGQIGSAQLPHSERALGALAEGQTAELEKALFRLHVSISGDREGGSRWRRYDFVCFVKKQLDFVVIFCPLNISLM